MRIPFRVKVVALTTILIATIFTIAGIAFTLNKIEDFRKGIMNESVMYIELTNDKIGDAFSRFYFASFFKFREIILSQKRLNIDLENIQVVEIDGKLHFDYKQMSEGTFFSPTESLCITDNFVLRNLKKMETVKKLDGTLKIISPYIGEHGIHQYSIIYDFSMVRLRRVISTMYSFSVLIGVVAILSACVVAMMFANRITSHLTNLNNAAKTIAAGDFSRIVDITTNDEFEDLAKVFNYMTDQIRRNNRELKNLVRELESRDEQKAQFLANLSHELRTPLTASLGYVDYLEKGKLGSLTEEQLNSLAIIKRNLERLNSEIHSLLQISKHALEGIAVKRLNLRFQDIIESVISDFEPEIRSKKLAVKREFAASDVYADRDQLRTVLENLMGNAVKFSDTETELKIASNIHTEDSMRYFQFTISNRGAEIPKKKLNKIFEAFYQVDATTTRKHGGIGLGLSIARSIIEAHGGQIWALNEKGATIFSFILPDGEKNEET